MATRSEQIERLMAALASAGMPVVNSFNPNDRPATLRVATDEGLRALRVFCWNVTPGGAHRAEDEYRVQTTRPGDVPLYVGGDALDLVLGYDEGRDLFVAWDAALHPNPGGSSSLQVQLDQLEEAAVRGFVARTRDLGHDEEVEVVVAFKPDAIRQYLAAHEAFGVRDRTEGETAVAAADGDDAGVVEELPGGADRKRVLASLNRLVRDGRFRVRVLIAYQDCCAFCGLGLRVVEAAHVLPVALGGADQVRNGVAACPTHHAAFDLGLILIEDDYSITVNGIRLGSLGISDDDVEALTASVDATLRLPAAEELWPALENVRAHRAQWQ